MDSRFNRKWPALFFILSILVTQIAFGQTIELKHRASPLPAPLAAPDFSLLDTEDKTHNFSDYRGKVIIVNFWAVWCPPCRKEMPSLERLRKKMLGKNVVVLAINQGEDTEQILPFLWELTPVPGFPILLDKDMKVSSSWKVSGLPTTYIVNKKGMIVYRMIGGREFDHPEIVKVIDKLLAE